MIKSFADKDTERLFNGSRPKKLPPSILKVAFRKLEMIDAAEDVGDLRHPPGNRLEKLSGDLAEKYSIRINRQWRVVFSWTGRNAEDVTIVDYHD